jgi:hypothetical protein
MDFIGDHENLKSNNTNSPANHNQNETESRHLLYDSYPKEDQNADSKIADTYLNLKNFLNKNQKEISASQKKKSCCSIL